MAFDTNKGAIDLPPSVASEIIAKTQEESAIMKLARADKLPGNGEKIPVITDDVEANWVGETEEIPVSNPKMTTKMWTPYKLSVIVPFSNEFQNDYNALYNALVSRIPLALAKKFDGTVFGNYKKPGDLFDNLGSVASYDIETDAYEGIVNAETAILDKNYEVNGYVISPKAKGVLLNFKDKNGRPIFVDGPAGGTINIIMGSQVYRSSGVYAPETETTPKALGFLGQWSKAVYGVTNNMTMAISDQANLTTSQGTINLWQRDMFAVKVETRVGFRCETDAFAKLVGKVNKT